MEMNKMNNEMIPLTIANTLDQSMKTRVEVPDTTIKQAVKHANLAPKGNYDVYDSAGVIISNNNTRNYRDSTVYVGVPKVAGGAPIEFDDDWDEDGIDLDNFPEKPAANVTLVTLGGERHQIAPRQNETLIQLAERAGLKPRDGTPIVIRDGDQNAVSNIRATDNVGRTFTISFNRIPGGAIVTRTLDAVKKTFSPPKAHPAVVPKEIIEQTTAFTQPRGRLEMGGLLIGHVDDQGNNVVVCGFFPEQTEASPGYCEFDGGAVAMAMGACDMANEKKGGPHTPNLRVIGWIHTHPDIGIFLSGIDVNTFGLLRGQTSDGRIVAVVVDPLRKEHGVFNSEKAARGKDATKANSKVRLSEDLVARYNKFLDRMRFFQQKRGKEAIPFIMPGLLYNDRVMMGDLDDIAQARNETLDKLYISADQQSQKITQIDGKIRILSTDLTKTTITARNNSDTLGLLRKENIALKQNIESLNKKYRQKHDENQELIQSLAVKIEELQNQVKSNSKNIALRENYALKKTKEIELRFEELTKKLARCMPFPKLLPLNAIKIVDNKQVQSVPQPINHDSDEDTVDE
jgi:proteasome lid subunit RPN8/RPN11